MNTTKTLKTSYDWQMEQSGLIILDHDGWDRENFDFSFYEEEITKEEFDKRVSISTISINYETTKK